MVKAGPTMALDDAIYALVLHWFAEEARVRGEHCTVKAAQKIRSLGTVFGVPERHTAQELEFNFCQIPVWPLESVEAAEKRVKECNAWHLVTVFQHSLRGMNVAAVERHGVRGSR